MNVPAAGPAPEISDRVLHARTLVVLRGWVAGVATLSALVGAVVLIGGSPRGIVWFRALQPGLSTMKANSAVCFVLCGVALWQSCVRTGASRRRRRIALAAAAVAGLIAGLTLAEDVGHLDLGIDQLLLPDVVPSSGPLAHPGRMSPFTGLCFMMLASAVVTLDQPRWFRLGQRLAVTSGFIAFLNVVAYVYSLRIVTYVTALRSYTEMAIHTAVTLLLLCIAVTAARPGRGATGIFAQVTAGGDLARRLLPVAIVGPVVLGAIRLAGERARFYGTEFGLALMAVANVTLFSVLIWWTAVRLHRTDARRQRAEAEVRRANEWLEERVRTRTAELAASEARYRQLIEDSVEGIAIHQEGSVRQANAAAARILGYGSAEDLVGLRAVDVIAPEFREEVRARVAARLQGEGVPAEVQVEALRKDGSRVWVESVSSVVEWHGSPATLVAFMDISDRRQREAAERQAAALHRITQLANAAAHEIYNPLQIVSGSLQLLGAAVPRRPDIENNIARCHAAIRRVTEMIGYMRRITRLETLDSSAGIPALDFRRSSENDARSGDVDKAP